jgi:hypothetical protein
MRTQTSCFLAVALAAPRRAGANGALAHARLRDLPAPAARCLPRSVACGAGCGAPHTAPRHVHSGSSPDGPGAHR